MSKAESLNLEALEGYDASMFDDDGRPKRTGKFHLECVWWKHEIKSYIGKKLYVPKFTIWYYNIALIFN